MEQIPTVAALAVAGTIPAVSTQLLFGQSDGSHQGHPVVDPAAKSDPSTAGFHPPWPCFVPIRVWRGHAGPM